MKRDTLKNSMSKKGEYKMAKRKVDKSEARGQ